MHLRFLEWKISSGITVRLEISKINMSSTGTVRKGGQGWGRSPMALCPSPSVSAGQQAAVSCSAEQGQGRS